MFEIINHNGELCASFPDLETAFSRLLALRNVCGPLFFLRGGTPDAQAAVDSSVPIWYTCDLC